MGHLAKNASEYAYPEYNGGDIVCSFLTTSGLVIELELSYQYFLRF
jgi:hypothetical protein